MKLITSNDGESVVFIDMDDGEMRRLRRIFAHAAAGTAYTGPLTTAFAKAVNDALGGSVEE